MKHFFVWFMEHFVLFRYVLDLRKLIYGNHACKCYKTKFNEDFYKLDVK